MASIGYMGQKGTHLPSVKYNINAPDANLFAAALDQGIDPTQAVPDPYGRVAANVLRASGQPGNTRYVRLAPSRRRDELNPVTESPSSGSRIICFMASDG